MKYKRPSKQQAQLEKDEPFTKRELRTYDKRERNFIRGIQFKEKIDKKQAVKRYKDYIIGNIKNRKKFRNAVQKSIKEMNKSPPFYTKKNLKTGENERLTVIQRKPKQKKKPVKKPKTRRKSSGQKPRQRRQKIHEIQGYSYNL